MPLRAVIVLLLALGLVGCNDDPTVEGFPGLESGTWTATTDEGVAELSVVLALSAEDHRRGLMGRTELRADAGMAFLFDGPTETPFWMKNTLIPLSIAFWNVNGRIISITDMQPCREDPCPTYGPPEPFVGAVEANLGWFREHGVEVGDVVRLEVSTT